MANESTVAETTTAEPSQQELANINVADAFSSALSGIDKSSYELVTKKDSPATETPKEVVKETKPEVTEATTEEVETTPEAGKTDEKDGEEAAAEEIVSKDPKAQARWSELKKELKAIKAEAETLRAEKQAASDAKEQLERFKAEAESLKKETEAMNSELALTRVEGTREFRQKVTEPLNQTFTQVETLAAQYKIDPNKLVDALYKDVSGDATALDELITDVPERHRNKIYALSENLLQIENRRADLKQNAQTALKTSIEREKAEREQFVAQQQENRNKEVASLSTKFQEKLGTILPAEVKIDYSAVGRDAMQIETWDDQTKMYSGFAAVVLPEVLKGFENIQAELKKAKAENAKLRGGSPKSGSGHSPSSPTEAQPKVDFSKMTMDDFAKQSAARIAGGIA